MDPVSLSVMGLKAVMKLSSALLTKVDEVETLRRREAKFAHRYKKSIEQVAGEAKQIETHLRVTVQAGNRSAVTRLLNNPDGDDALKTLVTLLNKTRELLQVQDKVTSKMLDILREQKGNNPLRLVIDITSVSMEGPEFEAAMEEVTSTLEGHRASLRRQYDHFKSLFKTFLSASPQTLSPNLPAGPTEDREGRLRKSQWLNDMRSSFSNRPFQLTLSTAAAVDIANDIDITKSVLSGSEWFAVEMAQMGEEWITDDTPSTSESSVDKLARLQLSLLEKLLPSVDYELAVYDIKGSVGESNEGASNDSRCEHLYHMRSIMAKEIERIESKTFSIAFCGMVKAGKSLYINALTGLDLLPSDDLPATAWPCRLRHIKGQKVPTLTLNSKCFEPCIRALQKKCYGKMMRNYEPPKDEGALAALLQSLNHTDDISVPKSQTGFDKEVEKEKTEVYRKWFDLCDETKNNLLRVEDPYFSLREGAEGREAIVELLMIINDIIRICGRYNIAKPANEPENWPLIEMEFDSLCHEVLDGAFEFIDLPGLDEAGVEFHEFQVLVRDVAKQASAIVPIVSFEEISKEDWRMQFSDIIADLQRKPNLVLCTHLDQVSAKERVRNLTTSVAKLFWPTLSSKEGRRRVLPCATRMGIGARSLLKASESGKPSFESFWDPDSILYDCAIEVLGETEPRETYNDMHINVWRETIKNQLSKSGLPKSIHSLVNDVVATSRLRTLKDGIADFSEVLRKTKNLQLRIILEMQRNLEQHKIAFERFLEVRREYKKTLEEWEAERVSEWFDMNNELLKEFETTEAEIVKKVDNIVYKTINEFQDYDKLTLTPSVPSTNGTLQMTFQPSNADLFLQEIQRDVVAELTIAKKGLVASVRSLASTSHALCFQSLRERIRTDVSDENLHIDLKDDIMTVLDKMGSSIDAMIFSSVRERVMRTIAVRYTGRTAYRAIEGVLAKRFLEPRPVDALLDFDDNVSTGGDDDVYEREGQVVKRSVSDLGFMVRAPITVIASVSWLLGSGIWPFLIHSQKVVMDKHAIVDQLHLQLHEEVFSKLQKEAQETMHKVIDESSRSAKIVVDKELKSEEEKYSDEALSKNKAEPVPGEKLAASLVMLLNFVAAESALSRLHHELHQM